jgi:hypothetical protein
MGKKILLKIAESILPKLLEVTIKLIEEVINADLDNDGKIGK